MRFKDTQLAHILREIKLAYLSHIPVVYIPTDQLELIKEIIYNDRGCSTVIPHLKCDYEKCADNTCIVKGSKQGEFGCLKKDNYFRNFVPRESVWDADSKHFVNDILDNQNLFVYIGSSWDYQCKTRYGDNDSEKKTIEACVTDIVDYAKYPKMSWDMCTNINVSRQSVLKDGLQRSLIIVFTTQEEVVPKQLIPYTKIIRVPGLSDDEIERIITNTLSQLNIDIEAIQNKNIKEVVKVKILVEMRGFTNSRIRTIIQTLVYDNVIVDGSINLPKALDIIRADKKETLTAYPGLKWENTDDIAEASGLGKITEWLTGYKTIFEDIKRAEEEGLNIPKGILISGIPGSGKSLMAKTAANMLNKPLISLDMGSIRGSHHGESENNLNRALAVVEKMAPCILWVDEIEKAFSGTSSKASEGDNGVGKRMFGKFLTWMQEKKSACFVFATANDITNLPPELFRSERFSRKFFTFLPTCEECAIIFANEAKEINKKYREKLSRLSSERRLSMPNGIFEAEVENPVFWIEILNDVARRAFDASDQRFGKGKRAHSNNQNQDVEEVYGWIIENSKQLTSGAKGSIKLFTGADISSIFKEILHALWTEKKRDLEYDDQIRYYSDDVRKIASDQIFQYKSYGETNIKNIVECFIKLYENNFIPASDLFLFDFNDYSEDNHIYCPKEINEYPNVLIRKVRYDKKKQMNYVEHSAFSCDEQKMVIKDSEVDKHFHNHYYNTYLQLAIIAAINLYAPEIKKKDK